MEGIWNFGVEIGAVAKKELHQYLTDVSFLIRVLNPIMGTRSRWFALKEEEEIL
jgi:hypothetical protein